MTGLERQRNFFVVNMDRNTVFSEKLKQSMACGFKRAIYASYMVLKSLDRKFM